MIGGLLNYIGIWQYLDVSVSRGGTKANLLHLQLADIRDMVRDEIVKGVRL